MAAASSPLQQKCLRILRPERLGHTCPAARANCVYAPVAPLCAGCVERARPCMRQACWFVACRSDSACLTSLHICPFIVR